MINPKQKKFLESPPFIPVYVGGTGISTKLTNCYISPEYRKQLELELLNDEDGNEIIPDDFIDCLLYSKTILEGKPPK